jgi:hypothetical protein
MDDILFSLPTLSIGNLRKLQTESPWHSFFSTMYACEYYLSLSTFWIILADLNPRVFLSFPFLSILVSFGDQLATDARHWQLGRDD